MCFNHGARFKPMLKLTLPLVADMNYPVIVDSPPFNWHIVNDY